MIKTSPIVIDDREPDFTTDFSSLGVPFNVARLPVGDFEWTIDNGETSTITIERKTVADFISSMQDGRIARFVENRHAGSYLLIEGDVFDASAYKYGNWTAHGVDNALVGLQESGISIIHSPYRSQTPSRIVALWKRSGKRHTPLDLVRTPTLDRFYVSGVKRDQVRVLMCLPHIGEITAREILKEMPLWDALRAFQSGDKRRLTKVRGVGPKTIDDCSAFLS